MTTVLVGQDSVSPSGMNRGLSVYGAYGRGTYTNLNAVEARFPGAKYVSVSPYVTTGVDCLDVEPGDSVPADCPAFVRGWTPVNTNKPVIYANAGTMGAVISSLSSAGIARSQYYLWVAEWDGSSSIPGGYDAKQFWSTSGYDSDAFYDYMFGAPVPVWPLKVGSSGPMVTALQALLNQLAKKIGLKALLTVDATFGAATQTAVILAQRAFGLPAHLVAGEVTEPYYTGLEHQLTVRKPVPVTVPVPATVCAPATGLKLVGEGPHSYKIDFTYAKQGSTHAESFEIVTCEGSHLGKVTKSYPRSVKFVATGTYGGQFGGVNTKASSYIVAVRALAAGGKLASEWSTVKLPKT
jgi:peptidoglycan hydrolase-like protein with peptidoglycan-binding domain